MNAMKNAAHLALIALWVLAGIIFSLKTLFVAGALLPIIFFWAWFAGYAAFTTWLSGVLKSPVGAIAAHGGTLLALHLVPKVMPFSVLRLGLDLLF